MEPEQNQESNVMSVFELCRELNLNGFPQKRNDSSWYFLRPDMMLKMDDVDALYGIDGKPFVNLFDQLIYYPKTADFIEWLGTDFQQLVQTNRSGFFAYANSLFEGVTTRSGGTTAWLALANVVYAKLLEKAGKSDLNKVLLSENVVEGKEPLGLEGLTEQPNGHGV